MEDPDDNLHFECLEGLGYLPPPNNTEIDSKKETSASNDADKKVSKPAYAKTSLVNKKAPAVKSERRKFQINLDEKRFKKLKAIALSRNVSMREFLEKVIIDNIDSVNKIEF